MMNPNNVDIQGGWTNEDGRVKQTQITKTKLHTPSKRQYKKISFGVIKIIIGWPNEGKNKQ